MGIFDDIVSPIKDAFNTIVSGVEVPIHVVENLFGEVITFTKELIQDFLNMIEDMRTMFNASNIENLFLSPFKDAALEAIGDVKKLYNLIVQASAPTVDGIKDELMEGINAIYARMKSGMGDMVTKLGNFLKKLEEDGQKVAHTIYSDMNRVKATLESFPVEIGMLKRKIQGEFKAITGDAFSFLPAIPDMVESTGANAFHAVKKKGQAELTDFSDIEQKLKNRFSNENAAIDLFYMMVIAGILIMLVSIFMVTKSIEIIVTIIVMLLIAVVIYAVVEFVIGVI